jgi:cytochrome P450 family 135
MVADPNIAPPGPRQPALIQTLRWIRSPTALMESCRARYGDAFVLNIVPDGPWLLLADPDDVRAVFTGDPATLHAGEGNRVLEPVVGRNSVLLLDEKPHLRQRRLLLPPFHGKRVHAYTELIREIAKRRLHQWPLRRAAPIRPLMQVITLDVITRAVFGIEGDQRIDQVQGALRRMLEWVANPRRIAMLVALGPQRLMNTPLFRFRRGMEAVDALLREEIRSRRASGERGPDVLSVLLDAHDEDGTSMSEDEIRDELLTMLGAGHETTATALAWAMLELSRHPQVLASLESELARDGDEYLEAVVRETLRLRPIAPIVVRRLTAPLRIAGFQLEPGEQVAPCIYLVQRHQELYPEPEAFRPERFLDRAEDAYAWIPFGGGVRRCLGASLAMLEMKEVLRTILPRARLVAQPGNREGVGRRGVTLSPARGGVVALESGSGPR